jgi:phenylpyruvate tautomerase PptA (4-oxalocrotonate tautomerase family)
MPMLDAYIPAGSLTPEAEAVLLVKLTDLLLRHEGVDPSNVAARSLAWLFVHRPAAVFVAGAPAAAPHYRFIASVPEGQFNADRRAAIVKDVTDAVLDAENGAYQRQPERVWVLTPEIADRTWGHAGKIYGLAEIAGFALGNAEKGRAYAEQTLAARKAH